MTIKETLLTALLIGVVILSVTLHVSKYDRILFKTVSFWVGFLAVWAFWSVCICALINNKIEIERLKKDVDRVGDKMENFLKQE